MAFLLDITKIRSNTESVYGIAPASWENFPLRIKSAKAMINVDELQISDIGDRNLVIEALHGMRNVKVEIEGYIQNWAWLFWAMGVDTPTGSNPYTHALTLSNSIPSIGMEVVLGAGDYGLQLLGGKVDSFDLVILPKELPTVKLSFLFKSVTVQASPTIPGVFSTTPFNIGQSTVLTLVGTDRLANCERAQFTMKNGLVPNPSISSEEIIDISEGGRTLSASFDIRPEDESIINLLLSKTDGALAFTLLRAANDEMSLAAASMKAFVVDHKSGGFGPMVKSVNCTIIGPWSATVIDAITDYDTAA